MKRHVALLRGINVGGHGRLPMRELVACFGEAGATEIETYIQSGNVVFASSDPESVTESVTKAIAARFGYPGRIVWLSAEELAGAYRSNPFAQAGAPAETLHVYFLADRVSADRVKTLDRNRSAGDRFTVSERTIYLHLPNGMARTRLTNAYFDAKLGTVCTARNWKTVAALDALLGGSPGTRTRFA